jgi:hypothetical protein
MDKLTALRTFGNPSISPAKRTKIFADRWYLVTMQNVERDPRCDYVGLGEGTYQELLPGNKARERRDARLNHCNHIVEWDGNVYEAFASRYGSEAQHLAWFPTVDETFDAITAEKAKHDKWIADCQHEQEIHETAAKAIDAGEVTTSILSVDLHRESAANCAKVIEQYREAFRCDIKKIR